IADVNDVRLAGPYQPHRCKCRGAGSGAASCDGLAHFGVGSPDPIAEANRIAIGFSGGIGAMVEQHTAREISMRAAADAVRYTATHRSLYRPRAGARILRTG